MQCSLVALAAGLSTQAKIFALLAGLPVSLITHASVLQQYWVSLSRYVGLHVQSALQMP